MNELLGRVSSFFVEPDPEPSTAASAAAAAAAAYPAEVAAAAAPSIALLCRPDAALALGSALAIGLGRRTRSGVSVVGLWRPGDAQRAGARAPAGRSARRLASSLRARDVAADPAGRVVRAMLPSDPDDAIASAERVYAATDAPVVLVIAGPRTDTVDALLARQDAVLVAAAAGAQADPVAELAAERLVALGPPVETLNPALPPMTRALASAGLAAPALRAIVDLGRVVA